jgi:TonB-dependent starch-binding outer membrane protein SusC
VQYNGQAGSRQTLGNDQLTWEEALQTNVGVDFAILNNRIFGSIDVFKEDTKNQLLNIQLPADAGYTAIRGNVGNVENKGLELELGAVVIDVAGFQYRTSFNGTWIANKVTDLGPGVERLNLGGFGTVLLNEPIGVYEGVPYAGVNPANGKAMWLDINNQPVYVTTVDDRRIIGNTLPKAYGGWTNTFKYRGIGLEVFFQYQVGQDAFLGDMYNLSYSGSSTDNQLVSQLAYWRQPGDITNVPAPWEGGNRDGYDLRAPGFAPTRFLADAGYVRLKQVTLGYDLPGTLLSKIRLRKVNVFVQAMNLVTWTDYPGIDPEVVNANNLQNVSTYGNYPNGKQITFGINLGL